MPQVSMAIFRLTGPMVMHPKKKKQSCNVVSRLLTGVLILANET